MTTRWFGEPWGAPVNEECPREPVPVGAACANPACERRIEEGDRGFLLPFGSPELAPDAVLIGGRQHLAYHFDCQMRMVLGPDWKEEP